MKRERPPMPPLAVRVQVAARQYRGIMPNFSPTARRTNQSVYLRALLDQIFGKGTPVALDHDPALILRPYNPRIKDVASRYTPHAHDPDALVYREKADHQQKTTGRKPGASRTITTKGSDIGLKTKFARLERKISAGAAQRMAAQKKRKLARPKQKIPSRPFPKRRK